MPASAEGSYSTHPFFAILEQPKTQLWLFLPLPVRTGQALAFLYFPGQSHKSVRSWGYGNEFHPTVAMGGGQVRCAVLPPLRAMFQAFHNEVFNSVTQRYRKVSPDPERSLTIFSLWATWKSV